MQSKIQCDPYQITNGIFHWTRAKYFTIHMETQKTPYSQSRGFSIDICKVWLMVVVVPSHSNMLQSLWLPPVARCIHKTPMCSRVVTSFAAFKVETFHILGKILLKKAGDHKAGSPWIWIKEAVLKCWQYGEEAIMICSCKCLVMFDKNITLTLSEGH